MSTLAERIRLKVRLIHALDNAVLYAPGNCLRIVGIGRDIGKRRAACLRHALRAPQERQRMRAAAGRIRLKVRLIHALDDAVLDTPEDCVIVVGRGIDINERIGRRLRLRHTVCTPQERQRLRTGADRLRLEVRLIHALDDAVFHAPENRVIEVVLLGHVDEGIADAPARVDRRVGLERQACDGLRQRGVEIPAGEVIALALRHIGAQVQGSTDGQLHALHNGTAVGDKAQDGIMHRLDGEFHPCFRTDGVAADGDGAHDGGLLQRERAGVERAVQRIGAVKCVVDRSVGRGRRDGHGLRLGVAAAVRRDDRCLGRLRVKLERRSVLLPDLAVQDPAVHRQAAVRTQLDAVAGDAVLQGGTQLVVLALVFVEQVAERLAAQLRAGHGGRVAHNAGRAHGHVRADVLCRRHDAVAAALLLLAVEVAVIHGADGRVAARDAADVARGVLRRELHVGIVVARNTGLHTGDAADGRSVHACIGIDAAHGVAVGQDREAVQTDDAACQRTAADGDRRQVDMGAAVQDHAVIALTHDTADRAPVLGGRGDRAGDGAVRDQRACAGLGLIHNTGDDARIDADAVRALDIDLCIFDGDVADDRAVGIGEQTGCDIVRRCLLRADAQAEDLVVLSVENTAEAVRSGIACRDPFAAREIDIRRQDDVFPGKMLFLIHGCRKGTQLIGRCDAVRVGLRAAAAVEDRGGIGRIIGRGIAEQGAVQGDLQRGLQGAVVRRVAVGAFDCLAADHGGEDLLGMAGVEVLRGDDLGGDDLAVLHDDADNDMLRLIAAVVHAVLIGIFGGRIGLLYRDIGKARCAAARDRLAVDDRPAQERDRQLGRDDRECGKVLIQGRGQSGRLQRHGRDIVDKRTVKQIAVLVVAGRNDRAEGDRRIEALILDGQGRILCIVAVIALADGRGHAAERADKLRPRLGRQRAVAVAVHKRTGLAACDAAEVAHAAVVHGAVRGRGQRAGRIGVCDNAEGVHGRDAARLGVCRLAVGVERDIRAAVVDFAALAVADEAARKAAVCKAAVFGADLHRARRITAVDERKVAAACQQTGRHRLFARDIDAALHAEILNGSTVHQGRKQAVVRLRRVGHRRARCADAHAGNGVATAVKVAAEGLHTAVRVADGGPLCAGQVEIGRQSDVGSVKVALRKERAEGLQLGKRADDPRILLRAVTAVKEVRRRDLGILIDSGAQDRLAVLIALPGIPCRRAQRSQLLCGKADILAGQPAVGAAEARSREALVHGVCKRLRAGVGSRDILQPDRVAHGARGSRFDLRAVGRHTGGRLIAAANDQAVQRAACGNFTGQHTGSGRRHIHGVDQLDVAGGIAVVQQAGRLADQAAGSAADGAGERVAVVGDHIAQRGAVCQHGAVAVDGSDAANAGQAALGDGGDRHIGPAVRDDAVHGLRAEDAAGVDPVFRCQGDGGAGDGAVVDTDARANAQGAARDAADERTRPLAHCGAVDAHAGQVQIADPCIVCQNVKETERRIRGIGRSGLRADGHAGDRVALAVERTGEGMDRRPVAVQGDIGIQRDILTGIGLAVRRRRCEGAQLRLGTDEERSGLGAVAACEHRIIQRTAEDDLAVREAPALPGSRAHGRKALGRVGGERAAARQVSIRLGKAAFGDAVVQGRGKGRIRDAVVRGDLVVVKIP